MLNLMLDLEAFGQRPRGLIVSVGAVVFDDELPPESCVLEGDENRFYGVIDNQDARDSRFVVDGDTMAWWATQGPAFTQLLQEMATKGERLEAMFGRFGAWLKRFEGTPIRHWANAPSYDTVMLENAFSTIGMTFPLAYKTQRDYRTMMELAHGAVRPDVPASGVHNALFDAVEQAKLATAALQMLRRQPAAPLIIPNYPTASKPTSPVQEATPVAASNGGQQVTGNQETRVFSQAEAPAVAKPLGQSNGAGLVSGQSPVAVAPSGKLAVSSAVGMAAASAEEVNAVVTNPAVKTFAASEVTRLVHKTFAPMTGITAVVFVDFDGVLQTPALADWQEMEYAGKLEQLLAEMPYLGVVPTTTHRETHSTEQILAMLPPAIAARTVGIAPVSKSGRAAGGRQAEIEAWLAQYPQVERKVAVDDETYLFRQDCSWLVATFKWMGWTEDTTDAVLSVLEGRVPEVKLVASLGGRGSVLPAGWADSEDEYGQRGGKQPGRGPLPQDEVRASSTAYPKAESAAVAQSLAATRNGGTPAAAPRDSGQGGGEAPVKQGGILRDKARLMDERNSRPGGWRGMLGMGSKNR